MNYVSDAMWNERGMKNWYEDCCFLASAHAFLHLETAFEIFVFTAFVSGASALMMCSRV